MNPRCLLLSRLVVAATLAACGHGDATAADAALDSNPKADDPRLVVERFAAAPDIVHPIGASFDARGRFLVIESHTHFRPAGYQGPPRDRIRIVEDSNHDGKADRFTTFFEGTTATMDIAGRPDGSVYIVERNSILRLHDVDGDGKAERADPIITMKTKADYPHNGLSGLAFDFHGNLYFGLGENRGEDYTLVGNDGAQISGGGEGGGIFTCSATGKGLARVAVGFWNPFGICFDIYQRIFAVENDPDSSPPCRLLNIVRGGDYGYEYRYGRAGRHPFQSWNGELEGTLPMVSGTGESPCKIVSYEAGGLPRDYVGNLLVAAWSDHRVERYQPAPRGASFGAQRQPFLQGGKDFRPVGLAVAPDGSLYITDWVLRDYNLHGQGAVWHLRSKTPENTPRTRDDRQQLASVDRRDREAAARALSTSDDGLAYLRKQLRGDNPRVRAAALVALVEVDDRATDLHAVLDHDPEVGLRVVALDALARRGVDVSAYADAGTPPELRRAAIASSRADAPLPKLLAALDETDPFLFLAAVDRLARSPKVLEFAENSSSESPRRRAGLLLACRVSGRPEARRILDRSLVDPDPELRFLAAKWVADDRLANYRATIEHALSDPHVDARLSMAYATAIARIDGRPVDDAALAEAFHRRAFDRDADPAARAQALRLVPANYPKLNADTLLALAVGAPAPLDFEAVRALRDLPGPRRDDALLAVVRNAALTPRIRALAIAGLAENADKYHDDLMSIATGDDALLRNEALRALAGVALDARARTRLEALPHADPDTANLVARVLGRPFSQGRPPLDDVNAWLKRLEGPADPDAGRRVFTHPKLAGCIRCHRAEGRGSNVGPALDAVGRTDRKAVLESILAPSRSIAPNYQVWRLAGRDGRVREGILVGTNLDDYTYLDAHGTLFNINTRDIDETQPASLSLMPDKLVDTLTDQEVRDVLAYLQSLR